MNLDLSQYSGIWAIEQNTFANLLAHVNSIDLKSHIDAHADQRIDAVSVEKITQQNGSDQSTVSVIDIAGVMTKGGSSMSRSGSTIRARQEVRRAANDPGVSGIVLRIDSPGGTVAGTSDLADEVTKAKAKKPVYAYVEDGAASAAYWVASQANKVYANSPTANIGSIGTFISLEDQSGKYAAEGIKPVVISSGGVKGMGVAGTEITDEQKQHLQEIVTEKQGSFTAAVANGRKMDVERVKQLADGRIHGAAKAQELGLIDGVKSFDDVLSELFGQATGPKGKVKMTETVTAPVAEPKATYSIEQIEAACDGADASHVLSAVKLGLTPEQASAQWDTLKAEREKADATAQELAELKEKSTASNFRGNQPIGGKVEVDAYEGAGFDELVSGLMQNGLTRQQAVAKVRVSNPDAYAEYMQQINPGRDVSHLLKK